MEASNSFACNRASGNAAAGKSTACVISGATVRSVMQAVSDEEAELFAVLLRYLSEIPAHFRRQLIVNTERGDDLGMLCDEAPANLVEVTLPENQFSKPHQPGERTISVLWLLLPGWGLRLRNEARPEWVALFHQERVVLELLQEPLLKLESRVFFLGLFRQALAAVARSSKESSAALNHAEACRNLPVLGV